MKRRLPSLTALRSFEAVARHLSFTKAADELFVTQTAVSHQVKLLSEQLELKLVARGDHGIMLTEEGKLLFKATRDALDGIDNAIQHLAPKHDGERAKLIVLVTPLFSRHWLAPRIAEFYERCRGVDLLLNHTQNPVEEGFEHCHVAISHALADWPGLVTHELRTEPLVPLCSPRLLESFKRPIAISDLEKSILISETPAGGWSTWLQNAGAPSLKPKHMVYTDDPNVMVEAGLHGEGFILESPTYVSGYLKEGALIEPFDRKFAVMLTYKLAYLKRTAGERAIIAFRDWILEQLGEAADAPVRIVRASVATAATSK